MRAQRVSTLAVVLTLGPLACGGPGVTTPSATGRAGEVPPTPAAQPSGTARPAAGASGSLVPRLVVGDPPLPVDGDTPLLFSPDDALLAVGDSAGLVRLFDASTGAPLEALRAHDAAVTLLVETPAGGMLSGDGFGELALWSPGPHGWLDARPTILPSRHRAAITSVSYSADGATMVSADRDGNALLWDGKQLRVTAQLDESEDSGDGVTVGRGAAAHYAVSADGASALGWGATSCFVLSLPAATASRRLRTSGVVLDAHAEGAGFALTRRDRAGATVVDFIDASGKRISTKTLGVPGVEPLGRAYALRREAQRFAVVSTAAASSVALTIELEPSDDATLVVSRSGNRALLMADDGLALIDMASRKALLKRSTPSRLGSPQAMKRVGQELLVADGSAVHLFDARTGQPRGRLPLAASRLSVSADGKRWAGVGSRAFVVEEGSREILFELAGEEPTALSPDLTWLATRSGSEVVVRRAEGAGAEVVRIALGDRYPTLLAFAPDSRSLLVADSKGQLERFDAKTGKRLASREIRRELRSLIAWTTEGIFAMGRTAGRGATLVQLDPGTLAVADETPAGEGVARTPTGSWSAWLTKQGVRVKNRAGATFTLPERHGLATSVELDEDEGTLYVGRGGSVELWRLEDLEASKTGVVTAERKPREPATPASTRQDSFGDALPAHALARYGTMRGVFGGEIEDVQVIRDHVWLIANWGRATLWSPATGAPIRRIDSEGTAGDRNTFLTSDERWIVSRGTTSLGVWSVATGERTATVERPDAKDDASALSPSGDRFVIGTEDGELRIYRVPGLELVHAEPRAHKGRIEALAYAPDGKLFASCGRFGLLRLNDAASGASKRTIVGPDTDEYAGCSAIAFSPDSRTVVANLSGVRTFDVGTGRELGAFAGWEGNLSQIAVSPNGELVALGRYHDSATVWDARKRSKLATLATPDGGSAVAFSASGAELWVGGPDGVLRSFDTRTWAELGARPVHGRIQALTTAEQGRVLVTADQTGLVRSWDAATSAPLAARILESYPSLVATSSGLFAESAGIRRLEPRTLGDLGPSVDAAGGELAMPADGSFAALVDGHRLQLVDLQTGKSQEISWGGGYVDAVAVDGKGRFVAAGGTNGAVRFFDRAGVEVGAGRAGQAVRAISFSPVEDVVFVCARQEGSSPSYVALDVPRGTPRWRLDELAFSASDALGVSADGQLVAFADHEALRLLDARSGAELGRIPTDGAAGAEAFAFSPDRKTLYASADRTVLAWDVSFLP